MSVTEERQQVIGKMIKSMMDDLDIKYTDSQLDSMCDFVEGLIMITKQIQVDTIIRKVKETL